MRMLREKSRILRPSMEPGRRVLVTSDIHANLPYLQGLLKKLSFSDDDILIVDGDFLEKGKNSIGTLRHLMELSEKKTVYTVLGNCDEWQLALLKGSVMDEHMARYFRRRKTGLLFEMLLSLDIDPLTIEHPSAYYGELSRVYAEEFRFLSSLPHAIETEHFIFCHAGLDGSKALEENTSDELTAREAFLREGQTFKKWIVTGHWPCVLYGENIVNANPIIDREHRIVTLDGGCVLKDDGQLNALILPEIGCSDPEQFRTAYYDPFPEAAVLDPQTEGKRSWYIRWGDSSVQVLQRGEEFSRCRHVRTGYEMDILTKYLFTEQEITGCNDCTDYVLPLEPGDRVGIVEETSRGYFVKHNGISGWYAGRLERSLTPTATTVPTARTASTVLTAPTV